MATAYKTHTGLLIALEKDESLYRVTITGTQVKELLNTPDRRAAKKYYDRLVKDYEARKVAEA